MHSINYLASPAISLARKAYTIIIISACEICIFRQWRESIRALTLTYIAITKLACAWITQLCKQRFAVRCCRGGSSSLCRGREKSHKFVNWEVFCVLSCISKTFRINWIDTFCLKVRCLNPNSSYLIKTTELWFQTSWHSLSATGKIGTWGWFRFWKPLPPRKPQARELLNLTSQLSEMNWYIALISHKDNENTLVN